MCVGRGATDRLKREWKWRRIDTFIMIIVAMGLLSHEYPVMADETPEAKPQPLHLAPGWDREKGCVSLANTLKDSAEYDATDKIIQIHKLSNPTERVDNAQKASDSSLKVIQKIAKNLSASPDDCTTVSILSEAHEMIKDHYEAINLALNAAESSNATISEMAYIKDRLRKAATGFTISATTLSAMSAQYGLYIGPSFSLNGDGSWKDSLEILSRFTTEAVSPVSSKICTRPFAWCQGFSEISYQTIGAVDKNATTTESPPFNPFTQSGGYFRFNGGMQSHISKWMGFLVGVGISSLPVTGVHATRLEPRYFGGLNFQTLYKDGAMGQLFIGYTYDRFWEYEKIIDPNNPKQSTVYIQDHDRWNVDGIFLTPGIEAIGINIAGRFYADMPASGGSPSEVRISLLLYQDLNNWMGLFNPLKRGAKNVSPLGM